MSDLDDVLTGIMLAMEKAHELTSLWELDTTSRQADLLCMSSMLRAEEGIEDYLLVSAKEIASLILDAGQRVYSQSAEHIDRDFGDLYIESMEPVQASDFYVIKYNKVPFPFELSHRPRSPKVSDLERKITRNITHELLTPINSMQGLNEQLSEALLDDSSREILSLHTESCSKLKTHLSDIVNYFSLSSTESQSYNRENFDLAETMFSISSKANRSILEGHRRLKFHLECSFGSESAPVRGYPLLLEQALLQLIENALKFTPDGGEVNVNCDIVEDRLLRFRVSDNGCGISESDQHIIFRPFILGDMCDTRTKRGIGLGLASALECVIIMSGNEHAHIYVDSAPGEGASFTFELPYEKSNYQRSEHAGGLDLPKDETEYFILVAEDNPTQQMIVDRLIQKLGFHSMVVENGVEALGEYIRGDTKYDLILMDIQMPGISGHEATRMIRKHEKELGWDRIPIVAITANIEKEVHSESLRCGMDGHYGKPVTRVVLDELIRKALLGISL
jgi:signal transduction histidine kinase/CheY-like chemotaxis protein